MQIPFKEIEIQNFKSIKHLKMDCSRVNVLVGGPNTGKSNILEALSLLGACYSQEHKRFLSDFIRYEKLSNLFYDQNRKNPILVKADSLTGFLRFHQNINSYDIGVAPDEHLLEKMTLEGKNQNLKQFLNTLDQRDVPGFRTIREWTGEILGERP